MPETALICGPGVEASRLLPHGALLLGIGDSRSNSNRHRLADFVLHHEDVGEIAVVALSPDMLAGLGLDQLAGDANAIAGFPQAAFEHIAHAQIAANLLHINSAALVGEGGVARDHE